MTPIFKYFFAVFAVVLPLGAQPTDQQIARQAIIHGNNLLAANPASAEGKKLLRTGMSILPGDDDGLLALALIERGRKPQKIATKIQLQKLLEVMIARATELTAEISNNRRDMQQALMFFKAAEPFAPTNRDILIGLKKLERSGYTMTADDWSAMIRPEAEPDTPTDSLPPEEAIAESSDKAAETEPDPFDQAPADASLFRGHKYKYFSGRIPWAEAKQKCEALGGFLVTIGSAAENDFVKGLAGGRRVWLGASDAAREGAWNWVRTGDSWVYRNWVRNLNYSSRMSAKKQREYEQAAYDERFLNDDSGDYLYMCPNGKWNARDGMGKWNPQSSSYSSYSDAVDGYICEWQK